MRQPILILALMVSACAPVESPAPTETSDVPAAAQAAPEAEATPTELSPTTTPTIEPPTPTADPSPTVSSTPSLLENYPAEGYGPVNFPEQINPLTGLPVEDPAILERRPLAVKISNGPRGIRPQWGLSLADHVFEYYQEVGRTRFNAIFYGQDAEVAGPIRSARFPDEDIVRMYKAFFAFGSADQRVLNRLLNSEMYYRFIFLSDYPCPPTAEYPLCRTDPNGYNHLVTNTALLSAYFTQRGGSNSRPYLDGLHFNAIAPEGDVQGASVTIRYSNGFYNRWEYDPASGRYLRYQDTMDDLSGGSGEAFTMLTDRLTEQPIMADNIIVLLSAHSYYSRTPEMWEIKLSGYGNAYLFRDGRVYEVSWARATESDLIAVTHPDGSRFPLRPGNSWYQVIGTSSTISNEAGDWRFVHVTP